MDSCVELIGPEKGDNYKRLNMQQGDPNNSIYDYFDDLNTKGYKDIEANIQLHYLNPRIYKCGRYIYGENYSLNNFDYPKGLSDKKQNIKQIEKLYEQAYLMIKAAGLIRYMGNAYYPKSLVRKHADQIGLTQYIQNREQEKGEKLNHIELAKEYTGSYQNWSNSLSEFINKKMEIYK